MARSNQDSSHRSFIILSVISVMVTPLTQVIHCVYHLALKSRLRFRIIVGSLFVLATNCRFRKARVFYIGSGCCRIPQLSRKNAMDGERMTNTQMLCILWRKWNILFFQDLPFRGREVLPSFVMAKGCKKWHCNFS